MSVLDGKLAVLSQAGSEVAFALAAELAGAGARLVLTDAAGDGAARTAAQLSARGLSATVCEVSLNADAIRQALDAITAEHGKPEILVNCLSANAASTIGPSVSLAEAAFRQTVEDSLIHAFLWSQAVGQRMLDDVDKRGGVIVNVTNLTALGGWPGWIAQSAALGGVHNLTHTLAVEWASRGVRVNSLVCGVTETTMQQIAQSATLPQSDVNSHVLARIPMGRPATMKDIANALLYLVHPGASYVSGEILRVDGGWDVWGRLHAAAQKENKEN